MAEAAPVRCGCGTRAIQPAHLLLASGALLRGDGGEDGPALFYLVAPAVRTGGLFGVVLGEVQDLREGFLAVVADVLIVGHTHPRENGRILDPGREVVQGSSRCPRSVPA